jgi:Resolvase, N terminal domain
MPMTLAASWFICRCCVDHFRVDPVRVRIPLPQPAQPRLSACFHDPLRSARNCGSSRGLAACTPFKRRERPEDPDRVDHGAEISLWALIYWWNSGEAKSSHYAVYVSAVYPGTGPEQSREPATPVRARRCRAPPGFRDVEVIDDDLGRSGSRMVARPGFERLVASLCAGEVGAVLCFDASRLARNGRDWHHLLELCGPRE